VPLASRKHEGGDSTASATGMRRESKLWLPLGTTSIGALVRSPDLGDGTS